MDTVREFRYGMSRAGVLMLLAMLVLAGLLALRYVYADLTAPESDSLPGLLFMLLIFGGILLPVPLLEITWWVQGRVVVMTGGLRWRGQGRWHERLWEEILGIGFPPPDAARTEDERIHVITRDGYEFIHGFGLRKRQELAEAVRAWSDMDAIEVVGRHTFLCKPAAMEQVRERAMREIEPPPDGLDFWAGRFRRL